MRKNFTLPELALVIAFLALLGAVVQPWCAGLRDRARTAGCMDHLRSIGTGLAAYIQDSGDRIPPGDLGVSGITWTQLMMGPNAKGRYDAMTGYVRGKYLSLPLLRCPAVRGRVAMDGRSLWWSRFPHYGIAWDLFGRGHHLKLSQAKHPAKTVFAVDSAAVFDGWSGMYRWSHDNAFGEDPWWGNPMARHAGGTVNTLSLGGNAAAFRLDDVRHPNTVFPFAGPASADYMSF